MSNQKGLSRRSVLKNFGAATIATVGLGITGIPRQGMAKSAEESRRTYKVYSPGNIGSMTLKNRFIKAATATESTNPEGRFLPHGLNLSPQTNKRTDQYGGSLENRVRIIKEIVEKIKTRACANFPILIKGNA